MRNEIERGFIFEEASDSVSSVTGNLSLGFSRKENESFGDSSVRGEKLICTTLGVVDPATQARVHTLSIRTHAFH